MTMQKPDRFDIERIANGWLVTAWYGSGRTRVAIEGSSGQLCHWLERALEDGVHFGGF
jgi:hypothetical protein